jgi:hypothetical protein
MAEAMIRLRARTVRFAALAVVLADRSAAEATDRRELRYSRSRSASSSGSDGSVMSTPHLVPD